MHSVISRRRAVIALGASALAPSIAFHALTSFAQTPQIHRVAFLTSATEASAKNHLDAGQQLRTLQLEPDQRALLLGIFPVTLKPAVYVANAADELLPGGGDPAARVANGMPAAIEITR